MDKRKRLIPALIIILTLILLQGCSRATMERAIALGEQPEPGSLEAQAIGADEEEEERQQCKVLALQAYCIGGEIDRLLESRDPYRQRETGELTEYDFRDKYWLVTVSVYEGMIMSVRREERPARNRTLLSLKAQIDRRYGGGENHSSFPPDAESSRGKEMAIYSNRAEALLIWERAGWRIRLQWKGRDPIQLIFEDTELMETYLASHS